MARAAVLAAPHLAARDHDGGAPQNAEKGGQQEQGLQEFHAGCGEVVAKWRSIPQKRKKKRWASCLDHRKGKRAMGQARVKPGTCCKFGKAGSVKPIR
ncbi:hypothetical protein GCM10011572_10320 [Pseudoduganella buxea]|uniref:Uncharacterized protein n=1 Tax=Pseudoduganella buxea TaxID=1949069 RepID=A0ABQ1K777_9BURK|nr:hypothetical protein GCM10011572_10320 [Pseudoduganella buxea]